MNDTLSVQVIDAQNFNMAFIICASVRQNLSSAQRQARILKISL